MWRPRECKRVAHPRPPRVRCRARARRRLVDRVSSLHAQPLLAGSAVPLLPLRDHGERLEHHLRLRWLHLARPERVHEPRRVHDGAADPASTHQRLVDGAARRRGCGDRRRSARDRHHADARPCLRDHHDRVPADPPARCAQLARLHGRLERADAADHLLPARVAVHTLLLRTARHPLPSARHVVVDPPLQVRHGADRHPRRRGQSRGRRRQHARLQGTGLHGERGADRGRRRNLRVLHHVRRLPRHVQHPEQRADRAGRAPRGPRNGDGADPRRLRGADPERGGERPLRHDANEPRRVRRGDGRRRPLSPAGRRPVGRPLG